MTYSANEIRALFTKAAIGAGHAGGVADELAGAGLWLLRAGLDGASPLIAALSDGGDGACAAKDGLAAIDLIIAGEESRVALAALDVPLLLIGIAGHLLRCRELALQINDCTVGDAGLSGPVPEPGADVTITKAALPDRVDAFHQDVPPIAWAKARSLARRTYVPATAASRANAGAGSNDND